MRIQRIIQNIVTKVPKIVSKAVTVSLPAPIKKDIFIKNAKNVPQKVTISGSTHEWKQFFDNYKQRHIQATEKYLLCPKEFPKKEVSNAYYDIVRSIQSEYKSYGEFNRKAHIGETLNSNDKEYYSNVISFMDKLQEDKSVLRYLTPYEGLQAELQKGILDFRGLTSCTTDNNFLLRWGKNLYIEEELGSKKLLTLPYLLKINLKSGQRVLSCNVTNNGKGVLLDSEVVLPEGKGIIKKIDYNLNYIEADFIPTS